MNDKYDLWRAIEINHYLVINNHFDDENSNVSNREEQNERKETSNRMLDISESSSASIFFRNPSQSYSEEVKMGNCNQLNYLGAQSSKTPRDEGNYLVIVKDIN